MTNIGVIGLGRMGSAIARRLTEQGHSAVGWTRSGRAIDGLAMATDLPALVAKCDTLILSLFDDRAVEQVLDAVLKAELSGKLIIDTSTVAPDVIKSRINAIEIAGASAVDAPISGGPELVLAGKCGVFIGGTDPAAARAEAALAPLSDRIFHVGPLGAGLVMKVINNAMIQVYMGGLSEMMPLAKRAGLSLDTALSILCGGPAGLPMIAGRMPKILGRNTEVGFSTSDALKDNEVFHNVARSLGLKAPILTLAGEYQQDAIADGLGDDDVALMIAAAFAQG